MQVKLTTGPKSSDGQQQNAAEWLRLTCESVVSRSLVLAIVDFPVQLEICNKIQDAVLTMYRRMENLSVHLSRPTEDVRQGLSTLYEAGIVVEKATSYQENEAVSDFVLTFNFAGRIFLVSVMFSSTISYLYSPYPLYCTNKLLYMFWFRTPNSFTPEQDTQDIIPCRLMPLSFTRHGVQSLPLTLSWFTFIIKYR